MIQRSLDIYRRRVAAATLDNYPEAWAAHYQGDTELGELTGKINQLAGPSEAAFWLLLPFGKSVEVTDSVLIFESFAGRDILDSEPVLYAVHLSADGPAVSVMPWIIGYSILEGGIRIYDSPIPSGFIVPKLHEVIGTLLDSRQADGVYSYEETVAAAIEGSK